jgi:2-oxo-3-hexenedioate decarboxylase
MNVSDLAQELLTAYERGSAIAECPSARDAAFDMTAAYAVEREFARRRLAAGRTRVGVKVGYANKAMWRALKLETLVWAHMYDDTVRYARQNSSELSLAGFVAPKIEPEIVVKLRAPITSAGLEAGAALGAVEWVALGFEIIDCPFPEWKFKPVDFVAAFGLHRALVVGEPQRVSADTIPGLVESLAGFQLKLFRNNELVEEGSGKNSLKSPALCVAELGGAILRQSGQAPLSAGELISTGTLTTPQPIAAGEVWQAQVEGLAVPALTIAFSGPR